MKNLFLFIFIVSLLFPLASLAGTYKICDNDPNNIGKCLSGTERDVTYSGLVPCGKEVGITGIGNKIVPCQFCHFFVMFDGIIKFVLELVIVIAVLMFVIGGFLFFFAGADPGQLQTAQKILTTTVQGLVIIFAAWIIVNTIFIFIGTADWNGWNLRTGWFKIDCPITLP